jgi:D-serine deaminase-like pyridoxal phosphate-dependent protein
MTPLQPSAVETPAVVIRMDAVRSNLRKMAEVARSNGVALRPHAKTHKLPELARLQLAFGAAGITVAKIAEAEVMAEGGVTDLFVAYPLVTDTKIERAMRLAARLDNLILGVDSLEGAARLSAAAGAAGRIQNVRLEIDTGLRRTGVGPDDAIGLAKRIAGLEHLRLTGIYTYRGAMLDGRPTRDLQAAGTEEGRMMAALAQAMRAEGLPIADVSVGSTPTAPFCAVVPGVTEIRPGTYIFHDRMQVALGVCGPQACAAHVEVTVVSRPAPDRIVIDGGSKTFATDVQPHQEPALLEGFGRIVEAPDAVFERMSEEHGVVRVAPHHPFRAGDRLRVVPNHICSTLNLHNHVYLLDASGIRKVPVAARGMLE